KNQTLLQRNALEFSPERDPRPAPFFLLLVAHFLSGRSEFFPAQVSEKRLFAHLLFLDGSGSPFGHDVCHFEGLWLPHAPSRRALGAFSGAKRRLGGVISLCR